MAAASTTNLPYGAMGYLVGSNMMPVAGPTEPYRLRYHVMWEIMRTKNQIAHEDGSLSVNFKKPDGVTDSDLMKVLMEMMERGNLKFEKDGLVSMKFEKDGLVSMKFDDVTKFQLIQSSFKVGGAAVGTSEISETPFPRNDWESGAKKAIIFLNAKVYKDFTGDKLKVGLVKFHLVAGMFEETDMRAAIEDGKLHIQLQPYHLEGNFPDNLAKVVELPEDVNLWKISSTMMEDGILTVTVTGDKQVPEKKLKKISKFLGSAKKALVSALPACVVMGGKMLVDDMTNAEDEDDMTNAEDQ